VCDEPEIERTILVALGALAAHDAEKAKPDGDYVLVPRVPTPDMLSDAGTMENYDIDAGGRADDDHIAWWSAMLAAAPQPAPAPVQVDGLPVAWRFWVDDPTSALMPHWTGWSADAGFRGLCEKLGHRAEFAYAIAATAADGAGELSQGVADARVGQYAVRELPGKWRKNATELGRSSDPKGIWNDTLMTCADELESALASHQESRNANEGERIGQAPGGDGDA